MIDKVIEVLLNQGVLGLVVLVLALVAKRKDDDLTAERKARIDDANRFTTAMVAMQAQVSTVVEKGSDIVAALKERDK
jgi:hypothetical protein